MQLIVHFKKTGFLRFLSAIETSNAILRTLRRAGIPMEYSHGFNPMPRVSFLDSAPTGLIDLALYVSVRLHPSISVLTHTELSEYHRVLVSSSPKGLRAERLFVSDIEINKAVDAYEYLLIFKEKPNFDIELKKHSGKTIVPGSVVENLESCLKKDYFVVRYMVRREHLFNPLLIPGVYLGLRVKAFSNGQELDSLLSKSSAYL